MTDNPDNHKTDTISQDPHATSAAADFEVRSLRATDPIKPITALLHRAYAGQLARGMAPLAGRQSVDVTRQRCYRGQTFVAIRRGEGSPSEEFAERLLGTILFQEREDAGFPPWFLRRGVTHFSQFAVDPALQKSGVGHALLTRVEMETASLGCTELALSMAEPDAPLRGYYERRGYRVVQTWEWPYTNYLSLIMSKPVSVDGEKANG